MSRRVNTPNMSHPREFHLPPRGTLQPVQSEALHLREPDTGGLTSTSPLHDFSMTDTIKPIL